MNNWLVIIDFQFTWSRSKTGCWGPWELARDRFVTSSPIALRQSKNIRREKKWLYPVVAYIIFWWLYAWSLNNNYWKKIKKIKKIKFYGIDDLQSQECTYANELSAYTPIVEKKGCVSVYNPLIIPNSGIYNNWIKSKKFKNSNE